MKKANVLRAFAVVAAVGIGVFALWSPSNAGGQTIPYTDTDAVARGTGIYTDYCASCHGANLEGQENWRFRGPDGMALAPPHDASGHTWHHPDAVLVDITTRGTAAVVGRGYESNMIGYGDILTEQEILDVLAYIKSTWPPELIEAHNGINAEAGN
ncbi:MAG: c-type cytochrome [Pseudomonadota bacterium]